MSVINHYSQLDIHSLQQTRLYAQGHPLIKLWRMKRRNIAFTEPSWATMIDQELDGDFVSINSAGWYFANNARHCIAVESNPLSKNFWTDVHIEHDIMTWHPTYLGPQTVLAYFSDEHRYCTMDEFVGFCELWLQYHPKLVIGLDPTKLKFNYLKFDFVDHLCQRLPSAHVNTLSCKDFHLLFTIVKL